MKVIFMRSFRYEGKDLLWLKRPAGTQAAAQSTQAILLNLIGILNPIFNRFSRSFACEPAQYNFLQCTHQKNL